MSINKATLVSFVASVSLPAIFLIADTVTAQGAKLDQRLRDVFFHEYPEAVRKFEDALDHFHATGRFRHVTSRNNDPRWVYIEVWKNGDCLRFNRRYDSRGVQQVKGQKVSNITILRTPELSARVHEPATNSVVLDLFSQTRTPKIDTQVDLFLMRFFKATYCLDDYSVMNGVQQKEWVLTGIASDPMQDGRIKADFSIRDGKSRSPSKENARATINFAPRENWTIRELFLTVGEPYNFSANVFIDDVIKLKEGAYIAKEYRCTTTGSTIENIKFELETFEETVPPASEFTLTALGLPEPIGVKPPPSRTWLWLLVAALAAAALAVFFTWLKRRHA